MVVLTILVYRVVKGAYWSQHRSAEAKVLVAKSFDLEIDFTISGWICGSGYNIAYMKAVFAFPLDKFE